MNSQVGIAAVESAIASLDITWRPSVVSPVARRRHVVKVVLDSLFAVAMLVLLIPLLLAVAVAIKLDSRGPVLFRQVRVGRDGRLFTMWKFRSMTVGAEAVRPQLLAPESDVILFKMRRDPRVTSVGRILRKFSLDELPQLFNVVSREMALVGPRPALPEEVAKYPPAMRRRLVVRPGITGLWQVSGRSDLHWDDAVRLDTDYVDHWSLWLDTKILARTPAAVFGSRGAY